MVWPHLSHERGFGIVLRRLSQCESGLDRERIEPRCRIERDPLDGPADLVITGKIDPPAIRADRRVGRPAQNVRHLPQRPRRRGLRIDLDGIDVGDAAPVRRPQEPAPVRRPGRGLIHGPVVGDSTDDPPFGVRHHHIVEGPPGSNAKPQSSARRETRRGRPNAHPRETA